MMGSPLESFKDPVDVIVFFPFFALNFTYPRVLYWILDCQLVCVIYAECTCEVAESLTRWHAETLIRCDRLFGTQYNYGLQTTQPGGKRESCPS